MNVMNLRMFDLTSEERNQFDCFFRENLSSKRSLPSKIRWLLKFIGISPANKGYECIYEAILLILENKEILHGITKELYPNIAKILNTTPSRVERSMRHSIETIFASNMSEEHKKLKIFIFGVAGQQDKITNSEFLAGLLSFLLEYVYEEEY